jgi:hypothetical protein
VKRFVLDGEAVILGVDGDAPACRTEACLFGVHIGAITFWSGQIGGRSMTIRRLLEDNKLVEPQEVERLNRAYRDVLRSLHLVDRNDPIAEIVAKTVIEIGATGVRETSEISKLAIKRLESTKTARSSSAFWLD